MVKRLALAPRDNTSSPVKKRGSIDSRLNNVIGTTSRRIIIYTAHSCLLYTSTVEKIVVELSGGNQQKVILGRWTSDALNMDILILDEPTKGIDVGTKAEIYQMVCDFAKEGKGVIFISSELTEVINVSDSIIVMHNGHITGKVTRQEATEESVLALAMLD